MRCDELTEVPIDGGGVSTCPRCGSIEHFSRRTTFAICGASGSGKSTIVEPLRSRLPHHIIFDSDALLGRWTDDWDAHFELVLRMTSAIADNDRHVVVSGSLLPERLDPLPSRDRLGEIVYIDLDCSDEERRGRLAARPRWRNWNLERVEEANAFAAELRRAGNPIVDTSNRSVDEVADDVAAIIRTRSALPG